MSQEFDPIFDRVLIKRFESALLKKSKKAGIVLPDTVQSKYQASSGVLIKCGEECRDVVKALLGRKVLFAKYSGEDITIDGEEYFLATDGDIFGEWKDDGEQSTANAA